MKNAAILYTAMLALSAFVWLNKSQKQLSQPSLKPSELHALAHQYPYLNEGSEAFIQIRNAEYAKIRKTRSANNWAYEGPTNIGGRVNRIAMSPADTNTLLIGTPGGGIFKTTNGGTTWQPVFNKEVTTTISDIVYQPGNSNIVYAATGDHALSSYSYIGNGIYKSTDGGDTWSYLALASTGIISKLYVDSLNPNLLYAAAMGSPFVQNADRGFYKSTDGGATWTKTLFLANDCGIGDFVVHPTNSQIIYATGRHRSRSNTFSTVNGPRTKIYKSIDGGSTWDTLSNGLNYHKDTRIGLAISKSNPNILYALFVDSSYQFGGIYKTTNAGTTWQFNGVDSNVSMGGFGWYFGKIFIAPNNDNTIYINAIDFFKSTNSGTSFNMNAPPWYTYDVHSDKHDLVFISPNRYWLATDGGVYKTVNGGNTWQNKNNFTSLQFYGIANNPHDNGLYYCGAQDNGTLYGNSQVSNSWQRAFGGDGFKPTFSSIDPNILIVETQRGSLVSSIDAGQSFSAISSSIVFADHTNWEMPYILSKANATDVFAGSYRMHLSPDNTSDMFGPISNDLTDFSTTTDEAAFHTITSIGQSSVNTNYIYAGTSDAKLWFSNNYGGTWTLVNAGLPQRYCTSVEAGYTNGSVAFCTFSGYRDGDSTAHIYRTNNNGNSWINIAGNLPRFAINDVLVMPKYNDSAIIVASDGGVYATQDAGVNWFRVGDNMPIFPVFDVELDTANNKLLAGTFAQGLMSINLDSVFKAPPVVETSISNPSVVALKVSPNPFADYIAIHADKRDFQFTLHTSNGTQVLVGSGYGYTTVSTATLASGNYVLSIWQNKKRVQTQQLVKR
ncbi:MAG: hypothetical protein RL660_1682 [Bacteroidota bacterium]|jgi:photosystem II stability/assembly factor-like uncharacterized protein